ncbi:uncharacterized protein [Halyomorpha halys]|uniref:uncharacterized protein n=1 Tax=Halyomorpha halys TaxID=286706 RepID=UPI0034D36CCD
MDTSFRFSRCIYCYCLILGIFSLLADSVWAIDSVQNKTWSPGFIVDLFSFMLAYVMWTVMAVELIRQKQGFEEVITELEKTDTFLQNPKYDATFYLIPLFLAVVANLTEKVIVAIDYKSFFEGIVYYLYMSPIVMFSSQYFFLMAVASDQMSYLTAQLRMTYRPWHFNDLITIHKRLCDTANKINSIYSIHLLIITSIPFIINTLKIYSAIMCVIRPGDYDDDFLLAENIFHVIMNSIVLWCLVHSSSSVQGKARKFNIELLTILLDGNKIGDECDFQQYLSMEWNVKPTACGFYNIGYPLLTSTLTGYLTLITYLLQLTGSTIK